MTIGGSSGDMENACPSPTPPPPVSKFFQFHAFFWRIRQNCVFTTPRGSQPRGILDPTLLTDVNILVLRNFFGKWSYPEIVPLTALIACNAMNLPGGDALSFSYRFHH